MKKNNIKAIIIMTIIIIINVTIIVTLFACHTTNNDTYTVHGKVVTTVSNGYCAVVDDDGEEWALYTDDTVECGDRVVIVLDNMGTNTIYDDEVVGIVME
jgi:hypothetical protein